MKICLVPVCYNAHDDAVRFLDSVNTAFSFCLGVELEVILSDNSTLSSVITFDARNYSYNFRYLQNSNIGYFPAFAYDVVYATSSRLMTASLGALVARQLRCPLYLDIRDIFVDTIKDVLPSRISFFVKPIFSMMERITVRTATRVNLVSAGFLPYFNSRYPGGDFVVFTNGIDDEFVKVQTSCEREESSSLYTVLYAGNMGEGQGLHLIIPQIARHFDGHLRFLCIGDGGRRKQLQDAIEEAGCTNVEITSPVPRSELIAAYQKADVLFLHLNDYDAFRKVLPSKIFEYAALGKPIWAGVAGYSAGFIQDFISNAAVFRPCNVEDAIKAFSSLSMVTKPRKEFVERFAREKIMKALAEDIIFVVRGEVK